MFSKNFNQDITFCIVSFFEDCRSRTWVKRNCFSYSWGTRKILQGCLTLSNSPTPSRRFTRAWIEGQVVQRCQEVDGNCSLEKFKEFVHDQFFQLPPASQDFVNNPLTSQDKSRVLAAMACMGRMKTGRLKTWPPTGWVGTASSKCLIKF